MALSTAFWEVTTPDQVVFHGALPEGTETRDIRMEPVWVSPLMSRTTRFPMMEPLPLLKARDLIKEATEVESPNHHVLVIWYWDNWDKIEKVRLRFFRGTSSEILRVGKEYKIPEWLADIEETLREQQPTAWDRLGENDDLV